MSRGRGQAGLPTWFLAAVVLIAALWCLALGRVHLAGIATPIDQVETVLADWRLHLAGPRPAPDSVVIVAVDDATVDAEGRFPLDRARLAELVLAIGRNGASGLALDMLLIEPGSPPSDAALASALSSVPSVLAAAGRFAPGPAAIGLPVAEAITAPLGDFAAAGTVGLVNVSLDAGGTPRHIPLLYRDDGGFAPSLVLAAASGLRGGTTIADTGITLGGEWRPLDLGLSLPIRYLGPAGTVRTVSARDVLAGRDMTDAFSGRVAIVGATATAIGDRFSTPFDSVLPGVEILATGIGQFLDGSYLHRDSSIRRIDTAATVLLAAVGIVAIAFLPHATGVAIFIGILLGWMGVLTVLFGRDVWMSAALPIVGAVPVAVMTSIGRQVFDRRHTVRLSAANEALGRFQPSAITRRIADEPTFLAEPAVVDAPVLFVDLSGYTGLSEALGAVATRDLLKSFHGLVVTLVEENGGVVMTFMGDGAMISFGVPDPDEEAARRAVATAFTLVAAVGEWARRSIPGETSPRLRVGGHFGPVVLSRLGHDRHQHIAMTGDTTNVASRLMDVAKQNGALVALSRRLAEEAGPVAGIPGAPDLLTTTPIRGRQAELAVAIWRLDDA